MDLDTGASMKKNIKYALQITFFIIFCHFSFSSLKEFYNGSVVYETIHNFDNEVVPFPSITLCPALKANNLVNLKINEIANDFNLQEQAFQFVNIYTTLKGPNMSLMEVVRNYSFTYTDAFNIDLMVSYFGSQPTKIRSDSNKLMYGEI